MNKYVATSAFLMCSLHITIVHSMLRPFTYTPVTEVMTPQKAKLRDDLCFEDDLCYTLMQQNNVTHHPITTREENWTCHQYTVSQALGYGISFTLMNGDFSLFYEYFEQVGNPQNNDIGFYVDQNRRLLHSGIVLNNRMRSKWGDKPYIFDHDYFTAPDVYDNNIVFFRLKSKHNNPQNKEKAACQFYYAFTSPNKYYSRSTHNAAEKPKAYPQFIQSKFPNAYIVSNMPKGRVALHLKTMLHRQDDDIQLYRQIRDNS